MYYIVILLTILLFIFGLCLLKKLPKKSLKVEKYIIIVSFVSYIFEIFKIGLVMGFEKEAFFYALPLGNVSPFVFTLAFISLFLPEKIRKNFRPILIILTFGFIVAGFGLTLINLVTNQPYVPSSIFDVIPHILLALLGFYYCESYNEEYSLKHYVFAGIFLVLVALLMLGLNAIFNTSFFGLNPYGNHNIYFHKPIQNCLLSNIIYFIGLMLAIMIGYLFQKLIHIKK